MMTQKSFICSLCGEEHPISQLHEFDGQELCPRCLEENSVLCSFCGQRLWRDDNAGDRDYPLCAACYDSRYTTCERCNRVIQLDEAFYESDDEDEECPLCHDCFSRRHHYRAINDYYFKPDPLFYGQGPRYFGVELEIDGAGEIDGNARRVLDIANSPFELIYCKHDGSLSDGFEIVTHPMSLDYHLHQMPWSAVMAEAIDMGYRSHKASTCGLHVHMNRDAFGASAEEQDAAIARILYFFEKHWEELLKFSRRTPRQLERWAARYGYKDRPKEILDQAKKGYGGRYTCVNLQNDNTIEFRIFRGTLKYNTLIATLQLLDRICDVALFMSDDELKSMPWTTFAAGCTAPELVQYLKERQLYVNEPVVSGGEI